MWKLALREEGYEGMCELWQVCDVFTRLGEDEGHERVSLLCRESGDVCLLSAS